MAQTLLHGTLHATIFEATSLPDSREAEDGMAFFRKLIEVVGLRHGSPPVYATVDLGKVRVGRTRLLSEGADNPRWRESFHIYCAHLAADVIFTVKVDEAIGATLVGRAYLPVSEIIDGEEVDRWLEVVDEERKPVGEAKIHVKLQFFDVTRSLQPQVSRRALHLLPPAAGLQGHSVPGRAHSRRFHPPDPSRRRGGVRAPSLLGGRLRRHHQRAASYLHHRLVRIRADLPGEGRRQAQARRRNHPRRAAKEESQRGRARADTGVGRPDLRGPDQGERSDAHPRPGNAELLRGHAGQLRALPAEPRRRRQLRPGPADLHHVHPSPKDRRGGRRHARWELLPPQDRELRWWPRPLRREICTPFHSLFRTLGGPHRDDFHQINFPGASLAKGGPREPWHDIHCRLEGPVAWDVLYNFEQRWRKQGGKDLLLPIRDLSYVIIPPSPVTFPEDKETWDVQLFRSIDGGAAFGFPETPDEATRAGLVSGKDNVIDRSIQDAYINAIRRAKNFIYIENQYFIGSSFAWKADGITVEEIGALHLVPKELSLKIASKIEAGERFTVYVVVPMWPEGDPHDRPIQAMLDWRRRTMEMMYADVAQALRANGVSASPRDYLAFFCIGNREVKREGEYQPAEEPDPDSHYMRAQQARRFMIYVHSKMMIVDDEYIIVGSANINQRSMDGGRDSEIAMGAYQPYHLAGAEPARGQVHGFRMALWYEHLGMLDDVFLRPESLECVQKVNSVADRYWDLYSGETLEEDLPGHLITYPVAIAEDGAVLQLPDVEFFPDTKAKVLGNLATIPYIIPPIITT